MQLIPHSEAGEHLRFIELAADMARQATCNDAHCGAVIV